ncbi:MAG: hypothetical protein ACI86M_003721 [Saprospiraceae bacterium]|jgi:hypothetical protein
MLHILHDISIVNDSILHFSIFLEEYQTNEASILMFQTY